jgi:hypothetical protein
MNNIITGCKDFIKANIQTLDNNELIQLIMQIAAMKQLDTDFNDRLANVLLYGHNSRPLRDTLIEEVEYMQGKNIINDDRFLKV